MSEQKHSPTPWRIDDRGVVDAAGDYVSTDLLFDELIIVACVNSYAAHFDDPEQAARDDVLGTALFLLQEAITRRMDKDLDADICCLLARVKS